MDILPDDEREAVEFIWVNEGHQKTSFDKIPASDQERLRRAVELRKEQIETHVLHDMLDETLSEGRRVPRRQQRFVLFCCSRF